MKKKPRRSRHNSLDNQRNITENTVSYTIEMAIQYNSIF
jgi:hypothetical protein